VKVHTIHRSVLVADLAWTIIAMGFAYLCRYGWVWHRPSEDSALTFFQFLVLALGLWILFSSRLNLDGFRGGWYSPAIVSQLLVAVSALMVMLLAIAYLRREYASRLVLSYFGIVIFLGFVAIRFAFRLHFKSLHRAGAVRRVVIVGNGSLARELATKVERHPEMLRQVVGFLCPAEVAAESPPFDSISITTRTIGVVDLLRPQNVEEIIVALPKPGHPEILDLAARCRSHGIAVSVVPHPYELYLSRTQLIDLDGLPLLQLHDANVAVNTPSWQRFMDLALGTLLFLLALPAVLIGAGLLRSRKGRAFCRELRCGKGGEPFWMYRLNSERYIKDLPLYELVLQHLSVTELPQLWNVLRGDMSLVGPRPEPPEKVKHYSDWQRQRLNVKPGITGLAQVHGLRDQHSSEDKTRFDLQYILNRSVFIHLSLLLQTFWTLAVRLIRLPRLHPEAPAAPAPELHPELSLEGSFTSAHSTQSSAD
jgi:lipopolysaccharide/colanic/teichoic acid biosynthesis glycosyltransferase